jgi:hypothetical protein
LTKMATGRSRPAHLLDVFTRARAWRFRIVALTTFLPHIEGRKPYTIS